MRRPVCLFCAAVLAALIAFVLFYSSARAQDRIIREDLGGPFDRYAASVAAAEGSAWRTVIDGPCASGCTMYLRNRNTCATQRARFFFHSGSTNGRWDNAQERAELMSYYPPNVQRQIARHGGLKRSNYLEDLRRFTASELGVPRC